MFKTALLNSFSYKTAEFISEAYSYSKTKAALNKLSYFASESVVGKCYDKFKRKQPYVEYSRYQAALDKISALISKLMSRLNDFFCKPVSGSVFVSAYFGFLNNKSANKIRAIGIFGFYFCLTSVFMAIASGIVKGVNVGWGAHVIPLFLAGMLFLALAVFGVQLRAAFKNSLFMRLLVDLLK